MWHTSDRRRSLFTLAGLFYLLLLSGIPTAHPQSVKFDHAALAMRALKQHIQPGYTNFARAVSALQTSLDGLCTQPSQVRLERVHHAFRAAIVAWGGIENNIRRSYGYAVEMHCLIC